MRRWGAIVRGIEAIHWLAIVTLVVSACAILAAATGAASPARWSWVAALAVAGPAALSDWLLGHCFLTGWENAARRRAGWPTYDSSFFEHHAEVVPIRLVRGTIRFLRLSALVGLLGLVWG